MQTIEIDFETFKHLTMLRDSEEVTYNDVIKELLKRLEARSITNHLSIQNDQPWVWKGMKFADGTLFRAEYKGQLYTAEVKDGALVFDGRRYKSPSAAAFQITRSGVNGWYFWECQKPGETKWTVIDKLRRG